MKHRPIEPLPPAGKYSVPLWAQCVGVTLWILASIGLGAIIAWRWTP